MTSPNRKLNRSEISKRPLKRYVQKYAEDSDLARSSTHESNERIDTPSILSSECSGKGQQAVATKRNICISPKTGNNCTGNQYKGEGYARTKTVQRKCRPPPDKHIGTVFYGADTPTHCSQSTHRQLNFNIGISSVRCNDVAGQCSCAMLHIVPHDICQAGRNICCGCPINRAMGAIRAGEATQKLTTSPSTESFMRGVFSDTCSYPNWCHCPQNCEQLKSTVIPPPWDTRNQVCAKNKLKIKEKTANPDRDITPKRTTDEQAPADESNALCIIDLIVSQCEENVDQIVTQDPATPAPSLISEDADDSTIKAPSEDVPMTIVVSQTVSTHAQTDDELHELPDSIGADDGPEEECPPILDVKDSVATNVSKSIIKQSNSITVVKSSIRRIDFANTDVHVFANSINTESIHTELAFNGPKSDESISQTSNTTCQLNVLMNSNMTANVSTMVCNMDTRIEDNDSRQNANSTPKQQMLTCLEDGVDLNKQLSDGTQTDHNSVFSICVLKVNEELEQLPQVSNSHITEKSIQTSTETTNEKPSAANQTRPHQLCPICVEEQKDASTHISSAMVLYDGPQIVESQVRPFHKDEQYFETNKLTKTEKNEKSCNDPQINAPQTCPYCVEEQSVKLPILADESNPNNSAMDWKEKPAESTRMTPYQVCPISVEDQHFDGKKITSLSDSQTTGVSTFVNSAKLSHTNSYDEEQRGAAILSNTNTPAKAAYQNVTDNSHQTGEPNGTSPPKLVTIRDGKPVTKTWTTTIQDAQGRNVMVVVNDSDLTFTSTESTQKFKPYTPQNSEHVPKRFLTMEAWKKTIDDHSLLDSSNEVLHFKHIDTFLRNKPNKKKPLVLQQLRWVRTLENMDSNCFTLFFFCLFRE